MATLEEALAGTRRGERWISECPQGMSLYTSEEYVGWRDDPTCSPRRGLPLAGWTRVEEPLLCPYCGSKKVRIIPVVAVHQTECMSCGARGPWGSCESAAREAWLKIGGKR